MTTTVKGQPSAPHSMALRDSQQKLLKDMLDIGPSSLATTTADFSSQLARLSISKSPSPAEAERIWKVLIIDQTAKHILSPVLKVSDLREHGVTLYLYEPLRVYFADDWMTRGIRLRTCLPFTLSHQPRMPSRASAA